MAVHQVELAKGYPTSRLWRVFTVFLLEYLLFSKYFFLNPRKASALKWKPVAVPYLKHNIHEFIKLIDTLMQKVESAKSAEMIMMLRETLDYDRWISKDDIPSPDYNLIAN